MRKVRVVVAAVCLAVAGTSVSPSVAGPAPRATVDRPDAVDGPQVHLIYFVPRDSRDERLDVNDVLAQGMIRMQSWLRAQSGGYRWRFDILGDGKYDATFVRGLERNDYYTLGLDRPTDDISVGVPGEPLPERMMGHVEAELSKRGFNKQDKRYLVFYGGDASRRQDCTITYLEAYAGRSMSPVSPRPLGSPYALVHLHGPKGCQSQSWGRGDAAGWPEASAMHVLLQAEGVVEAQAPHQCNRHDYTSDPGHVCTGPPPQSTSAVPPAGNDPERLDVLFPLAVAPLSDLVLDRGRDDYFLAPGALRDAAQSAFLDGPGVRLVPAVDPQGPGQRCQSYLARRHPAASTFIGGGGLRGYGVRSCAGAPQ